MAVHPIWSLDPDDWVPLGELSEGERLLGHDGPVTILSHEVLHRPTSVYNLEVHGEHVYQVGQSAVLVHNSYSGDAKRVPTGQIHHVISKKVALEIDNHPILKGLVKERDPRFVTQAIDDAAHRGYQRWHRDLDEEVVDWIRKNSEVTEDRFLKYLRDLYRRPDLAERFPNGF